MTNQDSTTGEREEISMMAEPNGANPYYTPTIMAAFRAYKETEYGGKLPDDLFRLGHGEHDAEPYFTKMAIEFRLFKAGAEWVDEFRQNDKAADAILSAPSRMAASSEGEPETEWLEEAIRLAEIGEYLYDHQSFSAGNGYDEPREFSINWEWQQSKPHEYGQGVLLAEAAKGHDGLVADGLPTVASKLRAMLAARPDTGDGYDIDSFADLHAKPVPADLPMPPAYAPIPEHGSGSTAPNQSVAVQVDPETLGDVSSLIAARCVALPGKLIDCPVCGAVDNERERLASVAVPVSEGMVERAMGVQLLRSDIPHSAERSRQDRRWMRESIAAALAVPDKGVRE